MSKTGQQLMKKTKLWFQLAISSCCLITSAANGTVPTTQDDLDNLHRFKQEIAYDLAGFEQFNEKVDPWSLNLSVGHRDLYLPGNGGLDLSVSRYYQTPSRYFSHSMLYGDTSYPNQGEYTMGFGWDIHYGYITHGSWSTKTTLVNNMASQSKPSSNELFTACYDPAEYEDNYEAFFMTTQTGRSEMLVPEPDGEYMAAKSGWRGGCADTGFIMYSPTGLKYVFDQIKYGALSDRSTESKAYSYAWYVSRIEDKFGNWINIHYESGDQALLDYVDTNDGRRIDFTYETIAGIKTLTQAATTTTTIDYKYDGDRNLEKVKIGGRELWNYSYQTFYEWYEEATIYLLQTLTTESGGVYTYDYEQGGRTYSGESAAVTIKSRTTSGNLPASTTTYKTKAKPTSDYEVNKFGSGVTVTGSRRKHGVTNIVEDNRCIVNIFNDIDQGNWLAGTLAYRYVYNNTDCTGEMEKTEYQWDQVKISDQKTERKFYAYYVGNVGSVLDDGIYNAVLREKKITREGNTYFTQYSDFTDSGQARTIVESSSQSHKRTTISTFLDPGYKFGRDLLDTRQIKSDSGTIISQLDYDYDANYNINKKTINGKVNSYTYFTDGNLDKITYEGSNRYDEFSDYYRGTARKITQPCAQKETCDMANGSSSDTVILKKEVYSDGKIKSVTDYRGNKVSYSYDSLGRLETIDYADAQWEDISINYSIVSVEHDGIAGSGVKVGSLRQNVTQGNFEKVVYHDGLLRPVFIRIRDTSDDNTITYQAFEYNSEGRQQLATDVSSSASNRVGVEASYDTLGRMTKLLRNVDNSVITETEFLKGYKVAVTDGEQNTTTTTYLEYGTPAYHLATLIEAPDSENTEISYNLVGQIKSIKQGQITESRIYDSNLLLCKTVRPETGITAFGYNSRNMLAWRAQGTAGNKTSCDAATVPTEDKVIYNYDNLLQLHTVNYPDSSPDKTYSYDANGNLITLTSGSTSQSYNYNSRNLLEDETLNIAGRPNALVLDYGYDGLGYLASLQYPDNSEAISFSPNALGQATQAIRNKENGTTSEFVKSGATYHPTGLVHTFTYGNGIKHETKLDSKNRPECIRDYAGTQTACGSNNIVSLLYGFDNNNNITSITNGVNSKYSLTSLTYDGVNRLKTTTGSVLGIGSSSLTYDGLGNILTYSNNSSLDDQSLVYDYDENSNLLTTVSDSGNHAHNYDFTSGYDSRGNVVSNGRHTFSYNLSNQMTYADSGTANEKSFVYDGYDRRIKTTKSNGDIEYSMYSQAGQLLYRETNKGGINYIFLGDKLIAKEGTGVVATEGQKHYKPFGDSIETPADDVGFAAHKFDAELGLSYMQARYYDPVIGRFMSNDPVGFRDIHSFNRYAYANNNPYHYIDSTGQYVESVWDAASLSIGLTSLAHNLSEGNWNAAIIDAAGVVLDGAALALPVVPGGAGVAIHASRETAEFAGKTLARGGCSFTPDTPVLLQDGYKSIVDIKVGDQVLAKNEQTGELSWREVTNTFKDWHEQTITFTVTDQNGKSETITTTAEHPFYLVDKGWSAAGQIAPGAILSGPKSTDAMTVVGIEVNHQGQYAYNLTVDTDHTYFVGTTNVWVHNICFKVGSNTVNDIEKQVIDNLNSKGEWADSLTITKIESKKIANPDPNLGSNQVRLQIEVYEEAFDSTRQLSVNYDLETGLVGIVKEASGK